MTMRTCFVRPPNSWCRGPPRVPSGGGFVRARAAQEPRCEDAPGTAASRWSGPRRSRPSWNGVRANEGPTAAGCELVNDVMATPTATGGDTSPNRDGPPGTRVNAPDRATQLPPPPRCTRTDAPTATNRHLESVATEHDNMLSCRTDTTCPRLSQPDGNRLP